MLARLVPCALLIAASAIATADPFPSTDQNPLLGGLSIQAPARLAPDKQLSAQFSLNWSSTAAIQQVASDRLIVDAESVEGRLQFDRSFGEKFSTRVQLPFRRISGGSLDSAIERWHSLFGLPNGDRSALSRDRLRISYSHGPASLVDIRDTTKSGMGDAAVDFGWQWSADAKSATSLWSSLSIPTGDAGQLTGIDAFTETIVVAHTRSFRKFEVFGHAGLRFGDSSGLLEGQSKTTTWLAMVGTDYRVTPRLALTLQLDAHSASFDSADLGLFGPAYILTFGGKYAFSPQWQLQFGAAEDVKVEASPDVSFIVSVKKSSK